MQAMWSIQAIGWILLFLGILCIIIAFVLAVMGSESGEARKMESRGVVLLGPVPIVWGYGRKGWLIAGIVGLILCLLWILFLS